MNNRNVYDIEVSDYKGLTYKLEAFRGKVILVVNTKQNLYIANN